MAVQYRKMTEKDVDTFIELRIRQLREERRHGDEITGENIDLRPALIDYYNRHMADGTFVSWLAVDKDRIVGTSGMSDMGVLLYTDFGFVKNGNFMQYKF